ncbi:kinase-like protein [Neurospora crassa]|uniref:Alpha-type protein kinase domain-containing protein n=1 Tax=Neurospora crassa (strain ATCC 24698 / 74-OR23-1A / CBS 708.71 / DSM 1257 / FGSC 987) TaxID=367110 RepID=Q7S916_NEUCR|nr:hypothetical protein NCU07969 [Neurospora crassa OR74A]EAA32866.1 hypothetical protein NCU07969 [Neurospora crassa OR74A]KHE85931.1 kinase-like protein [Neurospora crassa]|eukprot:XP_962102.1 hypothetical protein NCU07969 [Neurospora crassa OR74A]
MATKSSRPPPTTIYRTRTTRAEIKSAADLMLQNAIAQAAAPSPAPALAPGTTFSTASTAISSPDDVPDPFKPFSQSDASSLLQELTIDERKASVAIPRQSTAGMFKAVVSTDLLFLLDTTRSMGSYMEAAKQQVRKIVDEIGKAFFNEAEIRMAVASYKDHQFSPNVQFLDFTTSVDQVHSFLAGLSIAPWYGDRPEDVLGGIQQAVNASWKNPTRCMIHIGDAPSHGRNLHDMSDTADRFPNPGTEPHGLTYGPLLKQMISKRINYVFLRINNTTDRMAFTFSNEYAAALADTTLLKTNKYYSTLSTNVQRNPSGALMFREVELGITLSALQRLVVNAVTASATRTATRTASRIRKPGNDSSPGSKLSGIGEEDDDEDDQEDANDPSALPIETVSPQWEESDWFEETLSMQGFSLNVNHGANTLNEMMERDNNDGLSMLMLTIYKRRLPFAKGKLRMASYARTVSSTNSYVAKSFIKKAPQIAYLVEDMRCQALCKAFALEFNALLVDSSRHSIDFIATACFKGKSELKSGDELISIEPYIGVDYVKYNTNAGWVNDFQDPSNEAAQAFSHFTFERSRGAFLASDLQGVNGLLTDPVIHTRDENRFPLSKANLGVDGFKFFFATHECNDICRKLGLKSSRLMITSGNYDFRSDWPSLPDTLCCSNKLCGKILRRADTRVSDKYPGYQWCGMCFPQLESTTEMEDCRAPVPHHQFALSRFFHESQGKRAPRMCPEHDNEQNRFSMFMAIPATPAMLGGWAGAGAGAGAGTGGAFSMLSSMAAPSKPAASKTTQADASLVALWDKLASATVNLGDD